VTLVVGILCSDGVVMASDSAATYGDASASLTIGQQQVTKLKQVGTCYCLYASSGAIGISQILSSAIEKAFNAGELASGRDVKTPPDSMHKLGQLVAQHVQPYFRNASLGAEFLGHGAAGMTVTCSSLVAYCFQNQPCLFQIAPSGAPEQATAELPFVALGSGQGIADPFLAFIKRVLWRNAQPSLAQGRFAAAWTIRHATETNPGGVGGPLQMATLSIEATTPKIEFSGFEQHQSAIDGAEDALRGYFAKGDVPQEPPEAPKPASGA